MLMRGKPQQAASSLLALLALVLAFDQASAGAKLPPPAKPDVSINIECIVIFYTAQKYEGESFGFSTGEYVWDGVSPIFFSLWDFSKIEVGFKADDSMRSLQFSCTLGDYSSLYSLTELERVLALKLYQWPFRKENGGQVVDYENVECSGNDKETICEANMESLPGMDRKISAAAILFNFPDFDPSQGKRPPPPPNPPEPPSPPLPPIPPPPPPLGPPPPYVLKHKPGYKQRPVKLHSPRPPRPPPPFRPPPPYRTPPPSPPKSPPPPDTPYFPVFPVESSEPAAALPPYLPYIPYYPPGEGGAEVMPPPGDMVSPPVYGGATDTATPSDVAAPPPHDDNDNQGGDTDSQGEEATPPVRNGQNNIPAMFSPYLPYVPYTPPPQVGEDDQGEGNDNQ